MNIDKAQQIFDGIMLGDGGMQRFHTNAKFLMNLCKPLSHQTKLQSSCIEQSLKQHIIYEKWLADNAFGHMGMPMCEGYPKILSSGLGGRQYAVLATPHLYNLAAHFDEWYIGSKWSPRKIHTSQYIVGATKVIPRRILDANEFSAITLAYFFLGDGSNFADNPTHLMHRNITIATSNFSREEVYNICEILNRMGIYTTKPGENEKVKRGSGLVVRVSKKSINDFINIVEPYIREIFGVVEGPSYYYLLNRGSSKPSDDFMKMKIRLGIR